MLKQKKISSKLAISNQWTKIFKEEWEFSSGNKGEYIIVEKEMAIMIIVLHFIENQYFTYIVNQHRYPIGREIWQFPMGTHEISRSLIENAKKELKEETGLVVSSLKKVGEYFVDPGLSRQKCSVFIAENIISQGLQELEDTEKGMVVKKVSLSELDRMIANGLLGDSWGYTASYFINKYLKR